MKNGPQRGRFHGTFLEPALLPLAPKAVKGKIRCNRTQLVEMTEEAHSRRGGRSSATACARRASRLPNDLFFGRLRAPPGWDANFREFAVAKGHG